MFRPKHRVGDSRLAPVNGRKLENRINRYDLSAKGRLPDIDQTTPFKI
ncbi:MAG: hypothetical protein LBF88_06540 [Planctomycetaceae bacterium]|jgi:hypothetical protein|nr:hypothetical protein [Planctomycetaceae bacterium]